MRKKIIYGVCMLGLVALVATSCKKNEENANSFTASLGTLQAGSSFDGDDRAYIDLNENSSTYNLTIWETGDLIKVFNSSNGHSAFFEAQSQGNFVAFNIQEGDIGYAPEYRAFYPAEMALNPFDWHGPDAAYQRFELDQTQYVKKFPYTSSTYSYGTTSIPQAAVSEKQGNRFVYRFRNIFGFVYFKAICAPNPNAVETGDGNRYVKRMKVTDNRFNLWGSVTLKPNKIDTVKLNKLQKNLFDRDETQFAETWNDYVINHNGDGLGYSAEGGGRTLIYDYSALNEGKGIRLNGNTYEYLYMGLRPGAFLDGFSVTLEVWDDGVVKEIEINDKPNFNTGYGGAAMIKAGVYNIINLGAIDRFPQLQ